MLELDELNFFKRHELRENLCDQLWIPPQWLWRTENLGLRRKNRAASVTFSQRSTCDETSMDINEQHKYYFLLGVWWVWGCSVAEQWLLTATRGSVDHISCLKVQTFLHFRLQRSRLFFIIFSTRARQKITLLWACAFDTLSGYLYLWHVLHVLLPQHTVRISKFSWSHSIHMLLPVIWI